MKGHAYLDCVVETARYKQFPKTENGIALKPTYRKIRSQQSNSIRVHIFLVSAFSIGDFINKGVVFRIRIRIGNADPNPDPVQGVLDALFLG